MIRQQLEYVSQRTINEFSIIDFVFSVGNEKEIKIENFFGDFCDFEAFK